MPKKKTPLDMFFSEQAEHKGETYTKTNLTVENNKITVTYSKTSGYYTYKELQKFAKLQDLLDASEKKVMAFVLYESQDPMKAYDIKEKAFGGAGNKIIGFKELVENGVFVEVPDENSNNLSDAQKPYIFGEKWEDAFKFLQEISEDPQFNDSFESDD